MPIFRRAKPTLTPPGKPPRRRRLRFWVRALFGLLLLIPVLMTLCTQGPIATWLVSQALRATTGAQLSAKWTSLKLDGRLVVTRPRFIAPGVDGPAATFAEADRIELELDYSQLWSLRIQPLAVRIDRPLVRISQESTSNRLNVANLGVPAGATARGPTRLPRLDLVGGRFEFGEHGGGQFTVLQDIPVRGSISPADAEGFVYRLQLRVDQREGDPSADQMPVDTASPLLDGEFNFKTSSGQLKVTRLLLARIEPDRVPTAYRQVWRSLRMRGEIADATLRYDAVRGVETEFKLKDVALNVPVASGRPETTGGRMPRMENVAGTIKFSEQGLTASLDGLFEDLPCRVTLRSDGAAADAPYNAVIQSSAFRLERDPRILWFAPDIVRENFERFGGPTALVDARIEVKRAAATAEGPGPTSIRGTMHLREGRAEFDRFPYPIADLAGTITFDDDEMRIAEMVGRSPRGARLYAEGRWGMQDAAVDLQVTVTDIPIDDMLEEAVNRSGARELFRSIFSRNQYQRLLDAGLLITPQERDQLAADLAAATGAGAPETQLEPLRQKLATPVFTFGGVVDKLRVDVKHARQSESPYITNIDIAFKPVGLVPDVFPYPIIADDLRMKVDDEKAVLSGKSFRGLRGGISEVTASVRLGAKGEPSPPELAVIGRGVPVDSLLLHATPAGSDNDAVSIKTILRSLRIDGVVDYLARVGPPTSTTREVDYAVEISMDGLTATPVHASEGRPTRIEGLKGRIALNNGDVSVSALQGKIGAIEPLLPGEPEPAADFRVSGSASADGAIDLRMEVKRLDVGLAVEDLVGLVSAAGRNIIAETREQRHPQGRADLTAAASSKPGSPIDIELALTGADGLEIDMLRSRLGVDVTGGRAVLRASSDASRPTTISLDSARAFLWWQGAPSADVTVSGEFELPGQGRLAVRRELVASTTSASFSSGLVRRLIDLAAPPAAAELVRTLDPRGLFDADLRMTPRNPADPADWVITGAVRPTRFGFRDGDESFMLKSVSGEVVISAAGGAINQLRLDDEDWSVLVNGGWSTPSSEAGGPWSLDLTASATAERLAPSLVALLPRAALDAATDVKLVINRGLWFENATIRAGGVGDKLSTLAIAADINFADLAAELGLTISRADGTLQLRATRAEASPLTRLNLQLDCRHALLAGLDVENLAATLVSGEKPNQWSIPVLTADAYGGRVSGSGAVEPPAPVAPRPAPLAAAKSTPAPSSLPAPSPEPQPLYALKVQASGVRFGDILAQREEREILDAGPPTPEQIARISQLRRQRDPVVVVEPTGNASRGRVDAELSVAGVVGDSLTRRGRGSVRISGGDIVRLPLVVQLLEISNLNFPAGSSLDFAEADFYLDGRRITFDMLGVSSQTILVNGAGTVVLPDFELDLQFTSASRLRVPIISDLIETIRNELVTVTVSGTLHDPKFGTEPFAGTRTALREIFGTPRKQADAQK